MLRREILSNKYYWITDFQVKLYSAIEAYMKNNNLTKAELAKELGVTKGYVTQILNAQFDHRISKLIELSLAVGCIPHLSLIDKNTYIQNEIPGFTMLPINCEKVTSSNFKKIKSPQDFIKI